MSNIVIPKELPDLIDRFHFLWNKLRIIKDQDGPMPEDVPVDTSKIH